MRRTLALMACAFGLGLAGVSSVLAQESKALGEVQGWQIGLDLGLAGCQRCFSSKLPKVRGAAATHY